MAVITNPFKVKSMPAKPKQPKINTSQNMMVNTSINPNAISNQNQIKSPSMTYNTTFNKDLLTKQVKPQNDILNSNTYAMQTTRENINPNNNQNAYSNYNQNNTNYDKSQEVDYLKNAMEQAKQSSQYATDLAVKRLEETRPLVQQQYDKSANEAYLRKLISSNEAKPMLANRGIVGASADAYNQKIGANYENTIGANEADRARAIADINLGQAQAKAEGDIQGANISSNYYNQLANASINQDNINYQRGIDARNFDYQKFLNDRGFTYQQSRDIAEAQRYADEMAYRKALDERNFGYQQQRDTVGDQRYQGEFAYQQQRDTIGDKRYNEGTQYQQQQDRLRIIGSELDAAEQQRNFYLVNNLPIPNEISQRITYLRGLLTI